MSRDEPTDIECIVDALHQIRDAIRDLKPEGRAPIAPHDKPEEQTSTAGVLDVEAIEKRLIGYSYYPSLGARLRAALRCEEWRRTPNPA